MTTTVPRNRYFTEAQRRRADQLLERHAGARPPYNGLNLTDATLLHAALTGFHPLEARNSVLRSRGKGSGDDVVDLALLSPKKRAALPF